MKQAAKLWALSMFTIAVFLAACTDAPEATLPDETAVASAAASLAGTAIAEAAAGLPTAEPVVVEITRVVEVTREVPVTRLVEVVVTTTPEPILELAPEAYEITATEVLTGLMEAGLPIGDHIAYTAETDPNELLGRPGGYLSKVNFYDTRLTRTSTDYSMEDGGSIEVYPDAAGAEGRMQYLRSLGQALPLAVEYDFLAKNVLLRVSKRLLPEQAEEYQHALNSLLP